MVKRNALVETRHVLEVTDGESGRVATGVLEGVEMPGVSAAT